MCALLHFNALNNTAQRDRFHPTQPRRMKQVMTFHMVRKERNITADIYTHTHTHTHTQ